MQHDAIHTEHHGPLTINIVPDYHPMSPRDFDNLGVMFCAHPHYILGDVQFNPGDFESEEDLVSRLHETYDPRVIIPLYLLDHSGLAMRPGPPIPGTRSPFVSDSAGWDTSMVGFILDTADTRRMAGIDDSIDSEDIQACLLAEVEEYSTYLEGGMVGFVVTDDADEHLDSCGGFYSVEDALSEARHSAEHLTPEVEATRRLESAYREEAFGLLADRSILRNRDESIDDTCPVQLVDGGAMVTVRLFVPERNVRHAVLDPEPAT